LNPARRRWLYSALGGAAAIGSTGPVLSAEAPSPSRLAWPAQRATPPLNLPSEDGPFWTLASARGQVVLLNFWASWCEPCRSEMPTLALLATRHENRGLQVVTVNFRETDAAVRRYSEAAPLGLPVLRDRDGAAAKAWRVRTFPTTFAIDRRGAVAFSVIGEADWNAAPALRWVSDLL
jgi:thiol-disulfide isomerase/thioredoxin